MDGAVVEREVEELQRWCARNPAVTRTWPGDVIVHRIRRVLADGIIDEDERRDLHLLFEEAAGYQDGHQSPLAGIYDEPPPEMAIIDEFFVLTGTFLFGSRAKVKQAIDEIGGFTDDDISDRTQYLVVGSRATPSWKDSQFGNKIEHALRLRKATTTSRRSGPLYLVSEHQWTRFLMKPPQDR